MATWMQEDADVNIAAFQSIAKVLFLLKNESQVVFTSCLAVLQNCEGYTPEQLDSPFSADQLLAPPINC